MKSSIFFSLLFALAILTNCKKDEPEPSPQPSTVTCTAAPTNPGILAPLYQPVNQTLELKPNATQAGGVTYNWSGPNGFSATGESVNIYNFAPANVGTYSLTITSACGTSPVSTRYIGIIAQCATQDNTVHCSISSPSNWSMYTVDSSHAVNGHFVLSAQADEGDLRMEFGSNIAPATGEYILETDTGAVVPANKVRVISYVNSNHSTNYGTYQGGTGKLYVTNSGTVITASYCSITFFYFYGFGGTFAGSGRITKL